MIPAFLAYQERNGVSSKPIVEPGLASIENVLQALGNVHHNLRVIHVAGTNGKGSTVAYSAALFEAHGLTVGTFTSPAIIDVHDQICVNEQPITSDEFNRIMQQLKPYDGQLTEFELLTVVALLHFVQRNVDVVIIEVGLGGLEDATNVVIPTVAIITSIALEHTNYLGTTLAEIAAHKGGIIKNAPVVVGRMPAEADVVLRNIAQSSYEAIGEAIEVTATTYRYKNVNLSSITRKLKGAHQADNMALALTAFLQLGIALDERVALRAIAHVQVRGRFEEVLPNVYFDGAHNEASALALVDTLAEQFPQQKITFIVGMLADKAIVDVLEQLERVSDTFYFIDFVNERAAKAEQLYASSNAQYKYITSDLQAIVNSLIDEVVVVTGSLYLLTTLRKTLF